MGCAAAPSSCRCTAGPRLGQLWCKRTLRSQRSTWAEGAPGDQGGHQGPEDVSPLCRNPGSFTAQDPRPLSRGAGNQGGPLLGLLLPSPHRLLSRALSCWGSSRGLLCHSCLGSSWAWGQFWRAQAPMEASGPCGPGWRWGALSPALPSPGHRPAPLSGAGSCCVRCLLCSFHFNPLQLALGTCPRSRSHHTIHPELLSLQKRSPGPGDTNSQSPTPQAPGPPSSSLPVTSLLWGPPFRTGLCQSLPSSGSRPQRVRLNDIPL